MEDKLLTPEEVADILRLKARTIKGWLREGKLRGVKFGKDWRIRETVLKEFIERAEEKPNKEQEKGKKGIPSSKIELQPLLQERESEHLEFKEAKQNFDFQKLLTYCVALANEGGGMLVLGVSDKKPRAVVGTKAFEDLQKTRESLYQRIQLRVEVVEEWEEGKRILIFGSSPN